MPKPGLNLLLKGGIGAPAREPSGTLPGVPPRFTPKPKQAELNRKHAPKLDFFDQELDFEPLEIQKIHLYFMSEEEINCLSVVKVINGEKEERSGQLTGTISDPRLFPPTKQKPCSTCELPTNICPGHLGTINLFYPIINPWGVRYVISILNSMCIRCGKLLMPLDRMKRYNSNPERLAKIAHDSESLACRNLSCIEGYGKKSLKIKKYESKSDVMYRLQFKGPDKKYISTEEILKLFKGLSPEEVEALGFSREEPHKSHPKNFIFTSLPVIPPNHRPPNIAPGVKDKNHYITSMYNNIIRINNALKNGITDDKISIEELEEYVSSIGSRDKDGEFTSRQAGSKESYKTVKKILSVKSGIIRSNIQAKRCDRSGRSVLGPGGMDVPFGFLGVPTAMSEIQVMERVCDKNFEYLSDIVRRRLPITVFMDGMKINAAKTSREIVLRKGMKVMRPIRDGDPIIFDRNPTLHKNSMQGYIIKLLPGLTLRLHSSVTTPHNADFDGDEGNVHICPGYKARAEILYLSGCWNYIVGGQFSRPMIGLVFNAITSAYLLTGYGIVDDPFWDRMMQTCFSRSSRITSLEERYESTLGRSFERTGPALFSALLPENLYYNHSGVLIKNGILVSGRVMSKHISVVTRSIVHMIYHHYGTQVATQFISEGQYLLDSFIEHIGFTVGYRDCALPNVEAKVQKIVTKQIEEANQKINELSGLDRHPDREVRDFYDQSVQAALNTVKILGEEIAGNALAPDNALKIMADCGSKGKVTDIAQVIGIVGQQFVENRRPVMKFNGGTRFLPHYDPHLEGRSEKITSRGFVDQPLGRGMRPGQFFAHMMSSRIGLIDTALGTATTGYSQRKITKALEDVRYAYNTTICGDQGQIIQYAGGYDSYDPMEMMSVKCPGFGDIWSPVDIMGLAEMLNSEN